MFRFVLLFEFPKALARFVGVDSCEVMWTKVLGVKMEMGVTIVLARFLAILP